VTKKDTEFKSAQIEINSRHLEISFTLAISNSTVPTLAVIMLIICIDSLSLLATSGTAARLFMQTHGLYGVYVKERIVRFLAAPNV